MIIVFKPKTTDEDVQKIVKQVEDKGLTTYCGWNRNDDLWCYWRCHKG